MTARATEERGTNPRSRSSTAGLLSYVGVIACIGAGVIAHSLWQVTTQPVDWHWLWFAALTVASSAAVLQSSSSPVAFSVTETFTFSAVLLFGPDVGALTVAIDCTVISLRLAMRGLPVRRFVLNVTAPTLAMWIAAHLLFAMFDVDRRVHQSWRFAELAWPLSLSALVYYLLDTWMVAMAVALDEGRRVWRVWREHFVHLWISFLVGAQAGLIVMALGDLGFSFLAIVAPLPLLLYYAMRTWVERTNDHMRHLQEVTDQAKVLQQQQTLRLQTEVALRERDSQFRAVFDYALDALLLVDDERRLVDANPAACALLGVDRDALPATPIDGFLLRGSAEDITARWSDILAGGEHQGELLVATGEGERLVEFSFKAAVVPDRHLFIWRDVSKRKRLEAQLQQSQKMETVGRLAGGVAHDFNNLLTVILGNAGMVAERDNGSSKDEIQEIIGAATRAATLTRQLLAFSRKQVLQASVVNLNGIVTGVEKMLRRLLDQSIELDTIMDPAIWPVKVDMTQLEQVIVNLAVNARDAMPDGGRLVVETANVDVTTRTLPGSGSIDVIPGAYVRLTVSDTGSGMDEGTRSQIFEPFFTTKDQDRGTGLGLAMVYGIVRQSGGQVTVESAPGTGSRFHVYLPRVQQSPRPEAAHGELPPAVQVGSETVLLVEDETAVRMLARQALQRYGYDVVAAASGDEACQLAEERKGAIDLLVTDVVMPRMNGKELASTLRSRIPELKVVFMSGYAGEAVALQALAHGTVFLQKPFTAHGLARTVRELLDSRGSRVTADRSRLFGTH